MSRKEGSGLSRPTASAVEELVAATFAGDSEVEDIEARIDAQWVRGRSGVRGSQASAWLSDLASRMGLEVRTAVSPTGDLLGDVRLELSDGSIAWIEVKAQTTKRFSDLLQSDWIRDETDVLSWLCRHNSEFRAMLSPGMLDMLDVPDPELHFGALDLSGLLLADLALLSTRPHKAVARVTTMDKLADFLTRKYFLHLTSEGAQMLRLDQVRMAQRLLAGFEPHFDIARGGRCDSRVWLAVGEPPERGAIDFAYYVGYRAGTPGRHKLHPSGVTAAPELVRVT